NTSSINKAINAAHDIPVVGLKEQPSASSYANDVMFSFFASQSDTLQLDNEDLKQIDTDDFKEMDFKWQVAMITIRVKRFIKKTGRNLNFNGKEPVGFDKTRVECYNCHRRGHFAKECHAPRNQDNKSDDNKRRVVPVETFSSFLVTQQIHQILRYKVGIWYHAVPPPYTGNYMPPRADLSFTGLDDSVIKFKISETRTSVNENESIASKSSEEIQEEPMTVSVNHLIKDCTFYENNIVEKYVVNNKGKGTGQREVRPVWNNARRVNHHNFSKITHPYPKRNFVPIAVATKSGQVLVNVAKQSSATSTSTARPKGNPQYTLQDQGIFDSGCSRNMTGNKSFLTEYQEIDGGFVALGGSPKG
nr:ribonuclease H-like domain-containing protein [Tanacetum cinerariifolium]